VIWSDTAMNGAEGSRFPASLPPVGFVGRTDEQDRLRAKLAGVRDGYGGSVWIEGGPGIGKSELLAAAFAGTGWMRATEEADPFRAMLARLDDAARDRAADLAEVAAAIGACSGVSPAISLAPLFRRRPVILVLDDLHRVGGASLEIWSQLHQLVHSVPLLLVSATRPMVRPALDAVHARAIGPGGTAINLSPLTDGEAVALAHAYGHDPYVVDGAVRDAAGNPAYLRHLAGGRSDPPPELCALVADHLKGLTARARHTMTQLALAPPGGTAIDLAARTGRTVDDLRTDLDEAQRSGILTCCGGVVAFRHPIMRRVLRFPHRRRAARALPANEPWPTGFVRT